MLTSSVPVSLTGGLSVRSVRLSAGRDRPTAITASNLLPILLSHAPLPTAISGQFLCQRTWRHREATSHTDKHADLLSASKIIRHVLFWHRARVNFHELKSCSWGVISTLSWSYGSMITVSQCLCLITIITVNDKISLFFMCKAKKMDSVHIQP